MGKLSASEFDVRQRRPDFVVHLQVSSENTTTRLFAYRDIVSAAAGHRRFLATGNEGQRASIGRAGVGLGLMLNASINNVGFNPVLVPSTLQEDYDSKG